MDMYDGSIIDIVSNYEMIVIFSCTFFTLAGDAAGPGA
jgi:hypothetical protein